MAAALKGYLICYLIVTGICAAISLLFPTVVVIGLLAFLPGLILALTPTAFFWGSIFAVIWFALHTKLGDARAAAVALAGAATFLWLAPLPSRALSEVQLAAAVRPDVLPSEPVVLTGHIRIDMPAWQAQQRPYVQPVPCNGLCAAALFTDGVETVTFNPFGQGQVDQATGEVSLAASARTFHRVPRDRCDKTLFPTGAGDLGSSWIEIRALEAEWNIRLSTRDCIVAEPTRTSYDFVITAVDNPTGRHPVYGWDVGPRGVVTSRIEIRAGQNIALRKLIATTEVLAQPLFIGCGGDLSGFRFGLERRLLSNTYSASLKPNELLREHTNLAMRADPAATANLVRTRLQAMVADPTVTAADPGWAAVEIYFLALKPGTVTDADRELLPALIRDRRMTKFSGIWDAIRGLGAEGALLRAPMVERLADPGSYEQDEAIRMLGKAIGNLPPGTFSQPTPAESALLADPVARRRAPGLVARQADRGEAAVPLLLEIVDYHTQVRSAVRADSERHPRTVSISDPTDAAIVDAARVAFCRLGATAAAALPRLLELDRERGLPRTLQDEWPLALARLGQPIESFAKPHDRSGTTEQFHANLRQQLKNFLLDRDCRPYFI